MFHLLPDSARTNGSLADLAGLLSKMKEHLNQSQPNPGPRPPVSPCSLVAEKIARKYVNSKNSSNIVGERAQLCQEDDETAHADRAGRAGGHVQQGSGADGPPSGEGKTPQVRDSSNFFFV